MATTPAATAEPAPPKDTRTTVFRVLAGLLGLALGIGTFALLNLVLGWFEGGDREIHRIHDLAWGATGGLYISLGFLLQVINPERKIAAMQMAAAGVLALVIPVLLAGDTEAFGFAAVFLAVIALLVFLHPARAEFFSRGTGFNPIMAALAVIALVLFAKFAMDQIEIMGDCNSDLDEHCEEGHYAQMATLGLGAFLVGLLASFKTRGWIIPARCAAGSMVVFGLSQLVLDDNLPGFVGRGWGAAAVAGGLFFAAIAEMDHRKTAP